VDQDPNQDLNREATGTNSPAENETDVTPGGNGVSTATTALETEIEALRAQVEQLSKDRNNERDQHLRTLADFQNFRRRKEEERGADRQFANRELIIGLLPVLDNFERALAAAETTQSYEALVNGVKLTLKQLQGFLSKNGVTPIEAVGQEFDPNYHEAVMRVEGSGLPDNTVVEELQKGYAMNDRVLRPSMVRVAGGA
jgi:molecular chaperone GrpE